MSQALAAATLRPNRSPATQKLRVLIVGRHVERAVYAAMIREQLHMALVHAAVRAREAGRGQPRLSGRPSRSAIGGLDLSLVHVTCGDLPENRRGVHHHAGVAKRPRAIDGIWVTSPATAIDTARVTEFGPRWW
jgi:hypothetical protein